MKADQESAGWVAAWHAPSLRGRIVLLAGTVIVLLTATLLILVWVLQTTQTNAVARSQKHLAAVARSLATAYASRTNRNVSLATFAQGPRPPKLPPSLGGEDLPPQPPPPKPHPPELPPASPEEQSLAQVTASVLADDTGIEGGFFRPSDQRLVGYAFPTHEGPGDPRTLPARETPDIVSLASAAFTTKNVQQDQFHGPHDVVLFIAVPVCETQGCAGGPVGAAWLMYRIPGVESDRKRALLWSAFGFGTVASITVIFAFFVLRQVGQGTDAVLNRLTWMESDLEEQPRPANVGLAEFHRVLDGLDRLGAALRSQIERERELQGRVRQNERLAAIGQLAAGVAHELRNPLATIRLRAQMVQRKTQEEVTAQSNRVILAEVDRLDAIIERLLDFSRPIHLNMTSSDVSLLCTSAVERWQARHSRIDIRYSGPEQLRASVDSLRFEQILDNLIENAVLQHEDRQTTGPKIRVDCSEHEGVISLSVSDNAGGFSPAALKDAAQPFFTTRAKGTGLGLAITQEIVQALQGSLSIRNEADGATVIIQFPAQVL